MQTCTRFCLKIFFILTTINLEKASGLVDLYSAIRKSGVQERPFFDPSMPTKVTVEAETTAVLTCKVFNLSNHTVAWIRHRDLHILTIGEFVYTSDNRYQGVYKQGRSDYHLKISFVQQKDAGVYECQVSTKPVIAFHINLRVVQRKEPQTNLTPTRTQKVLTPENAVVATAEILSGPDTYIGEGQMINLTCMITDTNQHPKHIFWYHEQEVISYYSSRGGMGGVSIITEFGPVTTSQLLIKDANNRDQGTYTCSPSNTDEASTRVFVLKDPVAFLEEKASGVPVMQTMSLRGYLVLTTLVALLLK